MRGGRGMGHERLRVAEIIGDEDQLQRVEEAEGGVLAAFQIDADDRAARRHLLLRQLDLREVRQRRGVRVVELRMTLQLLGDLLLGLALTLHAQLQRLQLLEQYTGVDRAEGSASFADER